MKKSTRLIFSLTITAVGLVAAIPVTMKYKLRHSMFTKINPSRGFPVVPIHFDNVHTLVVSAMSVDLISADSFLLEMEERFAPLTTTGQKGDTLIISANQPGGHMRIYSSDLKVIAKECEVTVRGSYDPYNFASYFIHLDNSRLYTRPIGSDHRIRQHIGNLSITGAEKSAVVMSGSVKMDRLYLYDIDSIEMDETVGASDLKVEYATPVIVKSHSQDGKMKVEIQDGFNKE